MDIMNVYVIIGRGFTKSKIVGEIREEGYKHNFYFSQGQEWEDLVQAMKLASEVWVFGDATEYEDYEYAKRNGKDIWKMG